MTSVIGLGTSLLVWITVYTGQELMVELVACRYRTVRIQGELTWRNRWRTPREFRIGEAGGEGLGEWELMDFVPERRLEQPVTVVSMSSSTRSPTALRRT